jgi:hypothetical protein
MGAVLAHRRFTLMSYTGTLVTPSIYTTPARECDGHRAQGAQPTPWTEQYCSASNPIAGPCSTRASFGTARSAINLLQEEGWYDEGDSDHALLFAALAVRAHLTLGARS